MKKIAGFVLLVFPLAVFSQQPDTLAKQTKPPKTHSSIGIGIKAGFNFANVTNASTINGGSRSGFHAGIFLAPSSRSILGSRTELIFSRQGYNYSSGQNTGSVNLDYITLAQLLAINITKYVQIQIGAQTSYLLNAKADSGQVSTGNASADKILSYYNRFDYGFGGGIEIHPVAGLLIGARYNISFSNLYKQPDYGSGGSGNGGTPPSFIPGGSSINLKNNVVQLFAGYRF